MDIRKIIKAQTDIKLLLKVLLTDEQRKLFRRNQRHFISMDKLSGNDQSSSSAAEAAKNSGQSDSGLVSLLGFKTQSTFDRKLLMGILPHKIQELVKEKDQHTGLEEATVPS